MYSSSGGFPAAEPSPDQLPVVLRQVSPSRQVLSSSGGSEVGPGKQSGHEWGVRGPKEKESTHLTHQLASLNCTPPLIGKPSLSVDDI